MVLSTITFAFSSIVYLVNKADDAGTERLYSILTSFMGKSVLTFFFTLLTLTFLPSTAEMCAIKVIPALSRSEWLSDSTKRLVDIANIYVESKIKELESDVQQ
ncbi:MAG: hypothetical protein IKE23_12565 [Exiguobacterium sp.]|nr:hypothetical protein [Exiguobacterium sp.]